MSGKFPTEPHLISPSHSLSKHLLQIGFGELEGHISSRQLLVHRRESIHLQMHENINFYPHFLQHLQKLCLPPEIVAPSLLKESLQIPGQEILLCALFDVHIPWQFQNANNTRAGWEGNCFLEKEVLTLCSIVVC